ncbi:hypothetical protein ACEVJL_04685 [Pseudoflavonifractor sp. P01025]|uniref:hypothetical protein n=1 Tax=Flintibacter porci TaxID=3342383 RepID=UPI0035B5BED5
MNKLFDKFWKWLLWSALFALGIHCLFKIPAPLPFFEHVWGAGDILSYISTILLAWIAYWQNQRYKDEADKHQQEQEAILEDTNKKFLLLQENIDRQTRMLLSLENEKMIPNIQIGSGLTDSGRLRRITVSLSQKLTFGTISVHLKNIGISGVNNIVCNKLSINDIPYEATSSPEVFVIAPGEVCFLETPHLSGETQTIDFDFLVWNTIGRRFSVRYRLPFVKGHPEGGTILDIKIDDL